MKDIWRGITKSVGILKKIYALLNWLTNMAKLGSN